MTHSWRKRRVVTTGPAHTIADGVAGRRPIPAVVDDLLLVTDDAVLVQEASIIVGMRLLLAHAGLVAACHLRARGSLRTGAGGVRSDYLLVGVDMTGRVAGAWMHETMG